MKRPVEIDDLVCVGWCDAVSYAGWLSNESKVPLTVCLSYGVVKGLSPDGGLNLYLIGDVNNIENIGRTITIPHDWVIDVEIIRKEGERMKKKIAQLEAKLAAGKKKAPAKDKKAPKKPAKTPKKKGN